MAAKGTQQEFEVRYGGPYRELAPAKARAKADITKLWTNPRWIGEFKADGWRFLSHFGGGCDRLYLTGRSPDTAGRLSEKGLCAPMLAPTAVGQAGYTVIDGEIMPPKGYGFRDINGIMNATPTNAAQRVREIGPPLYYIFDVLFFNGIDVRMRPLVERRELVDVALKMMYAGNPLVSPMPASDGWRTYNFCDAIWSGGGEGIILKDLQAPYGKGWVKVKREHTLDVVITSFDPGKGKYAGQIGAAVVAVHGPGGLMRVGAISGMTDDERWQMTQAQDKYIGQVVEIAAQEYMKDGLRHPRYKRMRWEANPLEATFEKMQADLVKAKAKEK